MIINSELAAIEEEIDTQELLRLTFAVSEHGYTQEEVDQLIIHSRSVLSAFLRYREYVIHKLGGAVKQTEAMDDYHCVAGEEMNLIENREGYY